MTSHLSLTTRTRLIEQVNNSLESAGLQHHKILFVSVFGSRVYGTATSTSDFDLIVVIETGDGTGVKTNVDDHGVRTILMTDDAKSENSSEQSSESKVGVDITIVSLKSFTSSLTAGDPFAVEVICTPEQFVLCSSDEMMSLIKETSITGSMMLASIRTGFSTKSSWAEVRARKKFKDGEHLVAIKSQYHSYRILLFAIQIAKKGTIYDWNAGSDYLTELRTDLEAGKIDDAYLRSSYKRWVKESTSQTDSTGMTVATYYKSLLVK